MAKTTTRTPEQPREWKRSVLRGIRLALPLAFGAAVVYGLLLLAGNLIDSPRFRLKEIHYQGVQHLDVGSVDQLIAKAFPKNLWMIDLERLRQLVESENWVKSATVRRQFPDTLWIYITERTPVAAATIDDELRVVDPYGKVLDNYGPRYSDLDRPIVTGLKNTALENALEDNQLRMRVYLELLQQLDAADPSFSGQLSEIDVSNLERVAVVPTRQAIPVYLGSERFVERYQTFLSQVQLLERLREQHGVIESVDVTFDNRIIVHTPRSSEAKGRNQPNASEEI